PPTVFGAAYSHTVAVSHASTGTSPVGRRALNSRRTKKPGRGAGFLKVAILRFARWSRRRKRACRPGSPEPWHEFLRAVRGSPRGTGGPCRGPGRAAGRRS